MKTSIWSLVLAISLLQGCKSSIVESEQKAQSTAATVESKSALESSASPSGGFTEDSPDSIVGKDVPYVPTPHEVVDSMLELAQVDSDDIVYDLGSGDGRIVIAAALRGASAVGIELDTALLDQSRQNAAAKGVSELTEFRQEDIFETDLSEATVITMYLLPGVNEKMKPILLEQLKPGSRVVSHAFRMDDWEPDHSQYVHGKQIYLWTVP